MKKIGLIIHSLGIGGMERVMAQLAGQFAEQKKEEVHLILIGIKREVLFDIPDSVVIHRPSFEFNNSRRTMDTIRTIRFVRNKVKEINPDTILSFGEMWNNLVLLSLTGLKVPVYISDRSRPNKNLGRLHNLLRNRLYPKAAGYIAQTREAEKVCLQKKWNSNIKVIGNPIRKIEQNPAIEKENIVLTVGRIIETKHFDQLIKIFANINAEDWKLVIVGGDAKKMTLSEDLKRLIKELGVEEKVKLEGVQEDVESYYNCSKIFAFTSSSEGFPNVIGEALSAGLPVIAYDCVAGPSDMIEHDVNGYLIPLFNVEKFQESLSKMIEDEEIRKSLAVKTKDSIEKFSIPEIANQYYTFIFNQNYTGNRS
jgi:glycosyltransferase involved in cell wall biosynthesis